MTRKLSPNELRKRLGTAQEEYGRIKARIRDVGFICEGSLVERWMTCRKPNCRCSGDPAQLHGPYYQLTWKERGKSVCRNLPPEHARLYQEWIANRRELDSLLKQMKAVSKKAGRYLLDDASTPARPTTSPSHQPPPGPSQRR
jgi:hypothetical protein